MEIQAVGNNEAAAAQLYNADDEGEDDTSDATRRRIQCPFDSQGISSSHTDQSTDYATNTLCARSVEWLEFNEFDTY
ncbi:unnamed protein product [Mucor circinelloides]|uniref:Uncharacterized protein n=1 Tax=Mucor circinelloides f. circinelloides (strain 1006PhL) TaxID=1220926 RepID=S2JBE6_MUCC1|nr:hypothetical protein HMPREF1544_05710 [Mucor circinelloides 1006PhL]